MSSGSTHQPAERTEYQKDFSLHPCRDRPGAYLCERLSRAGAEQAGRGVAALGVECKHAYALDMNRTVAVSQACLKLCRPAQVARTSRSSTSRSRDRSFPHHPSHHTPRIGALSRRRLQAALPQLLYQFLLLAAQAVRQRHLHLRDVPPPPRRPYPRCSRPFYR